MRRSRIIGVLVTVVALLAVLAGGLRPSAAQDTGTGGRQLTEGVAVSNLGRQEIDQMPPAPIFLGLARLTFAPGTSVPALRADGPTILHVETGSLVVQTGDAVNLATPTADGTTVNAGEELLIPINTPFATRNDGAEPASVLRVALYQSAPEPVAVPGITFQRLAGEVVQTLPSGRAVVSLNRLTLTAGANTVTRTRQQDGPDLAYVEVGTLGITGGGIDTTLSAGNTTFVEAGVEARARNAGFGPLVLLVVSISEPGDAGAATPETGTPTS